MNNTDVVIGTRQIQVLTEKGNQNSVLHVWGNFILAKVIQFKYFSLLHMGIVSLTDVGCLYRLMRRDALEKIVDEVNLISNDHLRHMVGGHAPQAKNEVLYRFEFPEKPGALLSFLTNMGENWNISLFHYRNHGADIGRVLVGMQVPEKDHEIFTSFLKKLEYPYYDESDNLGYKLFLGKNS